MHWIVKRVVYKKNNHKNENNNFNIQCKKLLYSIFFPLENTVMLDERVKNDEIEWQASKKMVEVISDAKAYLWDLCGPS